MALHTPVLMSPGSGDSDIFYSAQEWRQFTNGMMQAAALVNEAEGILSTSELTITAQSSPNLTVQMSNGRCFVQDDDVTSGGLYFCWNDATFSPVGSGVFATPGSGTTLFRVVAQVRNKLENSGLWTTYDWTPAVVAGTTGANTLPAEPATAITLAQVSITSAQTSIANSQITDLRQVAIDQAVFKGADTGRTSTTQTLDPDLQLNNLQPGARYNLTGLLLYNSPISTDFQFSFSGVTTGTFIRYTAYRYTTGGVVTGPDLFTGTDSCFGGGNGAGVVTGSGGNVRSVAITGEIDTGTTLPVVAPLQWACNASGGTCTLMARSFLRANRMA